MGPLSSLKFSHPRASSTGAAKRSSSLWDRRLARTGRPAASMLASPTGTGLQRFLIRSSFPRGQPGSFRRRALLRESRPQCARIGSPPPRQQSRRVNFVSASQSSISLCAVPTNTFACLMYSPSWFTLRCLLVCCNACAVAPRRAPSVIKPARRPCAVSSAPRCRCTIKRTLCGVKRDPMTPALLIVRNAAPLVMPDAASHWYKPG